MMRNLLGRVLLATALLAAASASAEDRDIAPRVDKLEKEMHAVQRKVFPGGTGQYLEPEITAPAASQPPAGIPATQPIADLSARVDALEKDMARLTGQVEENGHAIQLLQDRATRDQAETAARLKLLEEAAPVADAAPPPAPAREPQARPKARPPRPASVDEKLPTEPAAPVPVATGEPAEDAYMAGYQLWTDKHYPEAETALKAAVAKYPKHRRASYAQNLLGRAYLDEGKPALAAEAFYANYQKMPKGERAPDSLYYLGVSLTQLKKPVEACKVYDELQDVYGATLSGTLKAKVTDGRAAAKCKP